MRMPNKIKNFLDKYAPNYQVIVHRTVYTAYDLAQTLKHEMDKVLKTLVIKADKNYVLVVIPASYRLDIKALQKLLKAKAVKIEQERIMPKLFKIKAGAISPFHGPLHKLPVYLDKAVLKTQKALVQAGSFEESVHLKTKDLLKAVQGTVGNFAKKHTFAKVVKSKKSVVKSGQSKVRRLVKRKK